jgi:5'-phosphate synthase pdxT subunit
LKSSIPSTTRERFEKLIEEPNPRIGVLAIQGDYAAHAAALTESGASPFLVRTPEDLRPDGQSLDGLVLPGGESTTVLKFLERLDFFGALQSYCAAHPVFGTCAGAILLARKVLNPPQRSLGLLDATVERNAYGRQIDSTILTAETALPGGPLEMVFIRAPRIVEAGPGVEILARRDADPVLVRQDAMMAATFHPELSADRRVHRLFVQLVVASRSK